jgi:predicted DnaQ family exonuclease/DinG family helicase
MPRSSSSSAESADDENWLRGLGLETFIALDLETTGLDPAACDIIEVGAVRFENGQPAAEFSSLVRTDQPLDPFITQLTGISSTDLVHAPRFADLADDLLSFIGAAPLVGQNLDFDLSFLRAQGHDDGLRDARFFEFKNATVADTAMFARIFWPELPSFSLSGLTRTFGVPLQSAHRALDDARACGNVLAHMIAALPQRVWHDLAVDLNKLISPTKHRSRSLFGKLAVLSRSLAKPPAKDVTPDAPATEEEFTDRLEALLGSGGAFERKLSFFRARPMQLRLSSAIEHAFANGEILLAEAPTGVGKSLAYLVPALRWALEEEDELRQVIVASHTKVLQDQLFQKDIRDVRAALGGGFRAAVLKGRNNYLCRRRLRSILHEAHERLTDADRLQLMSLLRWSEMTTTGDISEIGAFNPKYAPYLWAQVASDGRACAGSACSAAKGDFYRAAQERCSGAHVVFVNHALLLSDKARFVGENKRLVVDEAHRLERAAVGAMTLELSAPLLRNSLSRILDERSPRGLLPSLLAHCDATVVHAAYADLSSAVRNLFATIRRSFTSLAERCAEIASLSGTGAKLRFRHGDALHGVIVEALEPLLLEWTDLASAFQDLAVKVSDLRGDERLAPERLHEIRSAADDLQNRAVQFAELLREDISDRVTWIECWRGTVAGACSLHAAPISVARLLSESFWSECKGAVLTSATMTAGGNFALLRESLGLDMSRERLAEVVVDSPFNLPRQMRTFVPIYLPGPRYDGSSHSSAISELAAHLVETFNRGTLILCTSNDMMEQITTSLSPILRHQSRVLLSQQTTASLHELVAEFRRRQNAVLVGAASLWEGIDVVGDALQILVVTRLPFDVPSEPWVAARCESLQESGNDPFNQYSVPVAALRLKQGLGRLIRHSEDRGVAIVADPRLLTARYGYGIRQSLPVSPLAMHSESDLMLAIQQFFDSDSNVERT